ncbi:Tetratricopeptide repeat protein [Gemmata sp. SH-PL17]|uniref:tetratricopeptide repeat protein n=1 Tax=Gemmata sp. SH-PL17 TaxID=1630693 RepID=UPI00078E93B1|nr:hypothetical protein [Gemmata sp. SH-PL17]AMV29082.1 Tetratricopeptide repeat protein [Gemmata sp. SH-PL17]
MTSVFLSETSEPATLAAAEGQAALGVGDTALARQKFAEAGAILERDMKAHRGGGEKQFLRFLAATQYYKSGHYQKAQELASKIEARVLPQNVRGLLPQFLKDVKERTSPGYGAGVQQTLLRQQQERRPNDLLRTLQDHPYVLKPGVMAFLRATACETIGDFRAAALFFRTAQKYSPDDRLALYLATTTVPVYLATHHYEAEAQKYTQHQVELLPHPVTFVTAAVVAFCRATSTVPFRRGDLEQQVQYLDKAWEGYQQLPEVQQSDRNLLNYLGSGFATGARAWGHLGSKNRAMEYANRAVQLKPDSALPWVVRGIITYPGQQSIQDFRAAVEREETAVTPYYYLAHHSLSQSDFRSAIDWCRQALTRNSNQRIAAQLQGWLAVCQERLGESRDTVEAAFRKALDSDPTHGEVIENYRAFKEPVRGSKKGHFLSWVPQPIRTEEEDSLTAREVELSLLRTRTDTIREMFAIGT